MENENKPTETLAPNETKDTQGDNQDSKTFTQEEVDRIAGERAKRAQEKAKKEFEQELQKQLDERERLAKLSAEEKEAEARKKAEAEQAERLRDITLRENRADARELMADKGIPTSLVDFVVVEDADRTKENIETLEKVYAKAVEDGVKEKLKGETPTDKSTNTGTATHNGPTVI